MSSEVSERSVRRMNTRTDETYRANWDKIFNKKKKRLSVNNMGLIERLRQAVADTFGEPVYAKDRQPVERTGAQPRTPRETFQRFADVSGDVLEGGNKMAQGFAKNVIKPMAEPLEKSYERVSDIQARMYGQKPMPKDYSAEDFRKDIFAIGTIATSFFAPVAMGAMDVTPKPKFTKRSIDMGRENLDAMKKGSEKALGEFDMQLTEFKDRAAKLNEFFEAFRTAKPTGGATIQPPKIR